MELNELKSMWKEDYDNLQSSLSLNQDLLKKSNLKLSISQYEKLRGVSIAGRNMALVYAAISFVFAALLFTNFIFSLPLILGGLAMFYSFTQHLPIESKTDYFELSVIELQRIIHRFRIHTAKHKVYDGGIVFLWFTTIGPAFLYYTQGTNIYTSMSSILVYGGVGLVLFLIIGIGGHFMYKSIDKDLKNAEAALEEIDMFEGFTA